MKKSSRKRKEKRHFALVFWPECFEVSTIPLADVRKVTKNQHLRKGWRGELPWTYADGLTEIFEAKIIRLSINEETLNATTVDRWGEIIKATDLLAKNIQEEIMNTIKNKKAAKASKVAAKAQLDEDVINGFDGLFGEADSAVDDLDDLAADCSPAPNSKESCFCNQIVTLLTPEFVGFMERIVILFRGQLQSEPLVKDPDVRICLQKDVTLLRSEITMAFARSKKSKQEFAWQLFRCLVPDHMIGKNSTSGSFDKVREAILHYINARKGVKQALTPETYNIVVNRRLRRLKVFLHGTEDEIEQFMETRRKSAKAARERQKSGQMSPGDAECSKKRGFEENREYSTDEDVTNVVEAVQSKAPATKKFKVSENAKKLEAVTNTQRDKAGRKPNQQLDSKDESSVTNERGKKKRIVKAPINRDKNSGGIAVKEPPSQTWRDASAAMAFDGAEDFEDWESTGTIPTNDIQIPTSGAQGGDERSGGQQDLSIPPHLLKDWYEFVGKRLNDATMYGNSE